MTHIKKSTIPTKYKTDQLVKDLKSLPEVKLPPILVYITCLNLISIKLNTDINKCRTSYGCYRTHLISIVLLVILLGV